MHSLRNVWIQDELLAEHPAMSHLASLPTLEELCMDSHYAYPDVNVPPTTMRFSSLRRLFLTGLGAAHISSHFLSSINTASLQSLTLRMIHIYENEREGARSIHQFLSILSTTGALRLQHMKAAFLGDELSLKDLLIDHGFGPARGRYLRSIADGSEYLHLLCQFPSLRTIEFEIEAVIQVSDAFLVKLASSLPQLEHLSLVPRPCFPFKIAQGSDELPTFSGLLAVAERCPHLSTLRLAVRAALPRENRDTNVGPPPVVPSSNDSTRILDLFTTPVNDRVEASAVSAFLHSTFPNLERFRVALRVADNQDSPEEEKARNNACEQWSRIVEEIREAHRDKNILVDE